MLYTEKLQNINTKIEGIREDLDNLINKNINNISNEEIMNLSKTLEELLFEYLQKHKII